MRLTETVDLGNGRRVTVSELSVRQFRDLLRDARDDLADMDVDALLTGDGFDRLLSRVLPMTDLDPDAALDLTPSEIRAVGEAVRRTNPDFFGMLGGLRGLAEMLTEAGEALTSGDSTKSSRPS